QPPFSSCKEGSSSCQICMVTPITSQPCSFKSQAATEESTPPDMPTTTFFLLISILLPLLLRLRGYRLLVSPVLLWCCSASVTIPTTPCELIIPHAKNVSPLPNADRPY